MKTFLTLMIALFALSGCGDSAPREASGDAAPAGDAQTPDASATAALPRIDAKNITVSGISSGAYMATQMHLAFSDIISGAGLIAGGPYGCAQNSMRQALGPCISGEDIDVGALQASAKEAAEAGRIDPLSNLSDDSVWLFHGSNDTAVGQPVVTAAAAFYAGLIDTTPALVTDVPAAHGIPTIATGADCDSFAEPYLQSCNYDAAGTLLAHLLGALAPRASEAGGRMMPVSQRGFDDVELLDEGTLYIPASCEQRSCALHVVFHGCKQSSGFIGDAMVTGAGYNEWADTNNIVIFYPQAAASRMAPMNPLGCWDWWGFTGDDYDTRNGKQIAAIKTMIDRLAARQ